MFTDGTVTLRRLNILDKTRLALLANNKKIWDNVRDYIPYPYSEQDAVVFITQVQPEDPPLTFAIEHQEQFCGVVGLVKQADVHRITAEIGYWIGEPFWNKGIATRAVKMITRYGFEQLQLVRIHAGVFAFNKGSMRVLQKCGYKQDGLFQKALIKNGVVWDEHRFGIINDGASPLFPV